MSRLTLLAAILAALTFGCGDNQEHGDHDDSEGTGGETTKAPDPVTETDTDETDEDEADEDEAGEDEPDDEIETSIGMLEEGDQKLARAQKTCPVSDQPLGSMGIPLKLDVKGKTVFICCRGCKNRILADPDKYLAKLK